LTVVGTGSPNKLIFSLASGAPGAVVPQRVAIKSLLPSSSTSRRSWRALVSASVRDVNSGAAVPNAVVSGGFSPGGTSSCSTDSSGSCRLSSAALPNTTARTTLTITSVAGSNLLYDPSQNAATQVSISKP
jgi:hypothetical protein